MKRLMTLMAVIALLAMPVAAHHAGEFAQVGDIRVSHAWTQETGSMAPAVDVYVTIENTGASADRLVAVTTDFSQPGVFQASVLQDDGSVAVKDVAFVRIAAGQTVTFQPGGIHVVLNDVQQTLMAGDHFDMTLEFAEAGTVVVTVEVEEHSDHDHDVPAS